MKNTTLFFVTVAAFAISSVECFAISPMQAAPALPVAGFTVAMVDLASVDGFGPLPSDLNTKRVQLVMDRATIGVGDPDPVFERHTLQAWDAGLATGAYHVPFPTHPADAQAQAFLDAVKKVCRPGASMLLAIDWEEVCLKRQGKNGKCLLKKAATVDEIKSLVSAIKDKTNGASVMIYTRSDIIRANSAAIETGVSSQPLWVAQYWSKVHGQKVNYFPSQVDLKPWSDWDFWQYTEGNSPNLSTRVSATYGKGKQAINPDVSLYNGLPDRLTTFIKNNSWQCHV